MIPKTMIDISVLLTSIRKVIASDLAYINEQYERQVKLAKEAWYETNRVLIGSRKRMFSAERWTHESLMEHLEEVFEDNYKEGRDRLKRQLYEINDIVTKQALAGNNRFFVNIINGDDSVFQAYENDIYPTIMNVYEQIMSNGKDIPVFSYAMAEVPVATLYDDIIDEMLRLRDSGDEGYQFEDDDLCLCAYILSDVKARRMVGIIHSNNLKPEVILGLFDRLGDGQKEYLKGEVAHLFKCASPRP